MKRKALWIVPAILAGLVVAALLAVWTADLHKAAREGDMFRAKLILAVQPGRVNSIDGMQRTLLHWAARQGHVDMAELAIAKGAHLGPQDAGGFTPLHHAIQRGRRETALLLLANDAPTNVRDYQSKCAPLHIVAANGDKDMVRLMLDKGADVNAKTRFGNTPLHLAPDREMAEMLLAAGADVNAEAEGGRTPLHKALKSGDDMALVRLLVEKGASWDIYDRVGGTPVQTAAIYGRTEALKLFLEGGGDPARLANENPPTMLDLAAHRGHVGVVGLLLEHGAPVDARDKGGRAPLHWAAWGGQVEVAGLLLDKGADVNTRDSDGWTPVHVTAADGLRTMTDLLLTRGADVNAAAEDGRTPLHVAAAAKRTVSRTSRKLISVAEVLLAGGADIAAKDENGKTPLQLAADNRHHKIAQLLKDHESGR